MLCSRLCNHIIGNVPKEDVSIVTTGDEAILSAVEVLLDLLLGRQLVEKQRLFSKHTGYSLRATSGTSHTNLALHRLLKLHLCVSVLAQALSCGLWKLLPLALCHCLLYPLVGALNHLLLLFFLLLEPTYISRPFSADPTWVLLQSGPTFALVERKRAELAVELLLEVLEVVDLEELVEPDALDEVAVANSSHDRNDVDREPSITDLKVVGDEGIVLVANR